MATAPAAEAAFQGFVSVPLPLGDLSFELRGSCRDPPFQVHKHPGAERLDGFLDFRLALRATQRLRTAGLPGGTYKRALRD